MQNYVELKDGIWQQVHFLNWKHSDGTDFTPEDYLEHGFRVLVDARPDLDFLLYEVETRDNEYWELREDGQVHVTYLITPRDLDFVKRMAVSELNSAFEAFLHSVKADYPESEQSTWPTQREEVFAWRRDPDAYTPLLDGIALARGVDLVELKSLAAAQVDAYTTIMGVACGMRQKYRDAIYAAEDATTAVQIAREAVFYILEDATEGTE
jgi:hypothetical protein